MACIKQTSPKTMSLGLSVNSPLELLDKRLKF